MSHDFDRDLSTLYRAGASEEPPAALDRHIADAARKVDRIPVWRRFLSLWGGWQIGVGAFAVAVLSISLVTLMDVQDGMAPDAGAPPAATPSFSAPRADVTRPEPEEAVRSSSPSREEVRPKASAEGASGRASAAAKGDEVERHVRPTEGISERSAAVPEVAMERQSAAALASNQARRVGRQDTDVLVSPSAEAPVPPEAAEPSDRASDSGTPPAAPSAPARLTRIPQRSAQLDSERTTAAPDAWLDRIDKLLRAGRVQEAMAQMSQFRLRYPGYPIPSELKRLLDASEHRANEHANPDVGP